MTLAIVEKSFEVVEVMLSEVGIVVRKTAFHKQVVEHTNFKYCIWIFSHLNKNSFKLRGPYFGYSDLTWVIVRAGQAGK